MPKQVNEDQMFEKKYSQSRSTTSPSPSRYGAGVKSQMNSIRSVREGSELSEHQPMTQAYSSRPRHSKSSQSTKRWEQSRCNYYRKLLSRWNEKIERKTHITKVSLV